MQSSKQHSFINVRYIVITDISRTLYRCQPEWAATDAIRDGWCIVADNMSYDEAYQLRAEYYSVGQVQS